jgi:lipopolysaccharide export system protein LptA
VAATCHFIYCPAFPSRYSVTTMRYPSLTKFYRNSSIVLLLWPLVILNLLSPVNSAPQSAVKSKPTPAKTAPASSGQGLLIQSQTQSADAKTGVITAQSNVRLGYAARKIRAKADLAQYYTKQKKVILTGNVVVDRDGDGIQGESITYLIDEGKFIITPKANQQIRSSYLVRDDDGQKIGAAIIQSNAQTANTKTQIVTAQGSVRISYAARKLQGRANQLEYNIKQKQITLSGNVLIVQDGNSLQGDVITYAIDTGKFIAKNKPGTPVQSIYVLPEGN